MARSAVHSPRRLFDDRWHIRMELDSPWASCEIFDEDMPVHRTALHKRTSSCISSKSLHTTLRVRVQRAHRQSMHETRELRTRATV